MASKINADKAPVVVQKGWATLHGRLVGHLVSFLEPKDMLKAGTICKLWHQNEFIDAAMQRALRSDFPPDGLTRAQFMQYQINSRTGALQIRTLEAGVDWRFNFGISSASNCFISMAENGSCRVYDALGKLVCTLSLKDAGIEAAQFGCAASYLAKEELFLQLEMRASDSLPWDARTVCVFTRNGSALLRQFSLSGNKKLLAVYEQEGQMFWMEDRPSRTSVISVTDLQGKELWERAFPCPSSSIKFCKERRSCFSFSQDHVLTEHMLDGKEVARLNLSGHLPASWPKRGCRFEVSANTLCLQDSSGDFEIRTYDLQAADPLKSLCVFPHTQGEDPCMTGFAKLFHDKVFVPGKLCDTLRDRQGNTLSPIWHKEESNTGLLPVSRDRFLYCDDAALQNGWSLRDGRGRLLCNFTLISAHSISGFPWEVRLIRPDQIALFQPTDPNRVRFLEFTRSREEGKE